jgi:hypothetical protein
LSRATTTDGNAAARDRRISRRDDEALGIERGAGDPGDDGFRDRSGADEPNRVSTFVSKASRRPCPRWPTGFSRGPSSSGTKGHALSRRNFLIATIEVGIVLGYACSALAVAEFPLAAGRKTAAGDLFESTIWYSIGRDGRIAR